MTGSVTKTPSGGRSGAYTARPEERRQRDAMAPRVTSAALLGDSFVCNVYSTEHKSAALATWPTIGVAIQSNQLPDRHQIHGGVAHQRHHVPDVGEDQTGELNAPLTRHAGSTANGHQLVTAFQPAVEAVEAAAPAAVGAPSSALRLTEYVIELYLQGAAKTLEADNIL